MKAVPQLKQACAGISQRSRIAGFQGYCWSPENPKLKELLAEYDLRYGGAFDAAKPEQFADRIAAIMAIDNGPINCQLADEDTPVEEATKLTLTLMAEAKKQNAPVHLEVHRDTSISYQLERDCNEGRVAFNNGTSVQMINQHYRDVVDDAEQMKKFWKLTPKELNEVEVKLGTSRKKNTPIEWPTDAKLKKLVWQKPLSRLALDLNVSDSAIRKRCNQHDIELPKNGHWQREFQRAKSGAVTRPQTP
jgi:hypothetical protein